ncbi:MAG: hypothetical protein GXO34_00385 [Deltaproteobacteria bacterium]|nr:hypothetical protein [Deltaproteobacteria bacterium]
MAETPAGKAQDPIPVRIVPRLDDLMRPEDYHDPGCKKIRLRISIDKDGVAILGDSLYVTELEKLFQAGCGGGGQELEKTLCG